MTKQEVIAAILECNEKLGYVPSRNELNKLTRVSRRQIRQHFTTYARALRECRLEAKGGGRRIDMELLFRDWAGVARRLRKLPTICDYEENGRFSHGPLLRRFGAWMIVPEGLKQYAEAHGLAEEWKDVLEMVEAQEGLTDGRHARKPARGPNNGPKVLANRPMYGPLMRPCPLICGPVNESGVIYLFGTMAEQLGYVVLRMQPGFPDCEALRIVDDEHLELLNVEFEYESYNFVKHNHRTSECDLIVCWKHNWPDCPVEVLELREIARMRDLWPTSRVLWKGKNLTADQERSLELPKRSSCQNRKPENPTTD